MNETWRIPFECRNCGMQFDLHQNRECPDCGWRDPDGRQILQDYRLDGEYDSALHGQFEYTALVQPYSGIDLDELNKYGQRGWELVSTVASTKTSGALVLLGIQGFTQTDSLVFFFRRRVA